MAAPTADSPLVVVVAYHSDDHLAPALAGITGLPDVVVIDNDASAATAAIVGEAGRRYLAAPGNLGFAAAVNLGIRAHRRPGQDVLLLNPDARVTADDVRALHGALHREVDLAAVGPRLVGDDGAPQAASWPMPSPLSVWMDALGLSGFWRGRRFVVGAVLLLRGSVLDEIGLLDERFFLYAEESEWQLRAMRRGMRVAVVEAVEAMHVGGASSSDATLRNELFYSSGAAFARHNYGRVGAFVMWLGSLAAALRRSVTGSPSSRATNRQALRMQMRRTRSVRPGDAP